MAFLEPMSPKCKLGTHCSCATAAVQNDGTQPPCLPNCNQLKCGVNWHTSTLHAQRRSRQWLRCVVIGFDPLFWWDEGAAIAGVKGGSLIAVIHHGIGQGNQEEQVQLRGQLQRKEVEGEGAEAPCGGTVKEEADRRRQHEAGGGFVFRCA